MKKLEIQKQNIILMFIAAMSAMLNLANLRIEGIGNLYYAAAVRSMGMNLKNFFFVSFDPAGFVSIDKPPLGFWLQTISEKICGFSGWSLILPQALSGIISVLLIYKLVNKNFGSAAGLISAICLAVTPVFVATSRNNTIDNVLVLFLLLACLTFSIAVEKGSIKFLLVSMVLVGLGFNVKMLEAYMILPALYTTYLLASAPSMRKKIIHLSISTIVLITVSLSWALTVDAVPSKYRPYIDSSTNNTVIQLIFGHNGIKRLGLNFDSSKHTEVDHLRNKQKLLARQKINNLHKKLARMILSKDNSKIRNSVFGVRKNTKKTGFKLPGFSSGHVSPGITRLFLQNTLSDQIIWFVPLAILGFIAAVMKEKLKFCLDNSSKQSLWFWFMWFLPEFIYFSYSTGYFQPYYLTMLAPPVAALTGIGIVSMWNFYKAGGWKSWLLPIALIVDSMVQLLISSYFINSSPIVKILIVLIIILCIGSSVVLCILNVTRKIDFANKVSEKNINSKLAKHFVLVAMTGLLITPFAGSSATLFYKLNRSIPVAGLELFEGKNIHRGKVDRQIHVPVNSSYKLIRFLERNMTSYQKYLLVVLSANQGSGIIINAGDPIMAIGGFLGKNNAITLKEFKTLAKSRKIRYVMVNMEDIGKDSNGQIMNWVRQNAKIVPTNEYSDNNSNQVSTILGQLYDLNVYADS